MLLDTVYLCNMKDIVVESPNSTNARHTYPREVLGQDMGFDADECISHYYHYFTKSGLIKYVADTSP